MFFRQLLLEANLQNCRSENKTSVCVIFVPGFVAVAPDPFRGIGAKRKAMEPQKPRNSPGPGPEIVERQRVAKE